MGCRQWVQSLRLKRRAHRPCPVRAVQPQLHDDGLGLFAFEHVAAQPVRSDDNDEKLMLFTNNVLQ